MKTSDYDKVVYPCPYNAARKEINKMLDLRPEAGQDNMQEEIGETRHAPRAADTGRALEAALPGEKILLFSFGSGCDALWFEVTPGILDLPRRKGLTGSLAGRAPLDHYTKYLT